MTKKVIAIDLDGTLTDGFGVVEKIMDPHDKGILLLKTLKTVDTIICIWSCRPEYLIKNWLKEHNLLQYVDFVNDSPFPNDDRKIGAHVYIDDSAITWDGDLANVIEKVNNVKFTDPGKRDTDFLDRPLKLFYQGTGHRILDMFKDDWKRFWVNPVQKETCLLTICSHAKPYAKAYIHMEIRKFLWQQGALNSIDYTHISGAGITPTIEGFDYPYNAYDGNYAEATEEIRTVLREKITKDLTWWRENVSHQYSKIIVYLRYPSNTAIATLEALEGLDNCEFVFCKLEELPWALDKDPDDCLTLADNLFELGQEL